MQLLPERDCAKCTAIQQREWGCEEPARIPMSLDGEDIFHCPRRGIKNEPEKYASYFRAYKAYMRGYLPDAGSLEDQGHRYVIAMAVIENAVSEARAEQDRRERRKSQSK